MSDSTAFDRFNHTELYQACRSAGIECLPNTPREKLIDYLECIDTPEPIIQDFDQWRHGIMGFLLEYWVKVEAQLNCPAKSKDPRSCFSCIDQQVVFCIVQNRSHEQLIRIHLPNGETRP